MEVIPTSIYINGTLKETSQIEEKKLLQVSFHCRRKEDLQEDEEQFTEEAVQIDMKVSHVMLSFDKIL